MRSHLEIQWDKKRVVAKWQKLKEGVRSEGEHRCGGLSGKSRGVGRKEEFVSSRDSGYDLLLNLGPVGCPQQTPRI